MRFLITFISFLACTVLAPTYPSSVMESNNIVVAPKMFWMKSVTNDVAFSNAVNAVLGANAGGANQGIGECVLGGAGGVLIITNDSCNYTINLNSNAVRDLIVKGFGYLTNVVTTNSSAGFTGLVQSIGITFTNRMASTNYVNQTTNDLDTVLRAYITFSIDDATGGIAHTNDVIDATNGLNITLRAVIDSATNALASTNYVVTATNNLDTALRSVIASATNGHALLAQLVAATNTIDAAKITVGTLPSGRFPALTGDVTTSAGSVATTVASVSSSVSNEFHNASNLSSGTVAAARLPDLGTTYEPHVSTFTNQVQASNVLSGGTIPVGAINSLGPTFNGLAVTGAVLNVTATGSNNITGSLTMGAGLTNAGNVQAATINTTGTLKGGTTVTSGTSVQAGTFIKAASGTAGGLFVPLGGVICNTSGGDGIVALVDFNTAATFDRLCFGAFSSSFPGLSRVGSNLRLSDGAGTGTTNSLLIAGFLTATNGGGQTNFFGGYSRIVTNMAPLNTVLVTLTLGTSFTNTYGARGRLNVPFTLVDTVGGTPTLVFTNISTTETWNYATSFSLTGNYQDCAHIDVGNGEVVKFSDASGGGASVTLQAGSIKLE